MLGTGIFKNHYLHSFALKLVPVRGTVWYLARIYQTVDKMLYLYVADLDFWN